MKTFVRFGTSLAAVVAGLLSPLPLCAVESAAPDLVGIGIVAPRNLVLTRERPRVSKPFSVVIENRGRQTKLIPDAASLAVLVALEVEALGAAAPPRAVLVPARSFPIKLRPQQKLAVVFRVTFALDGPPGGVVGFRYAAKVEREPVMQEAAAVGVAGLPVAAPYGLVTVNGGGVRAPSMVALGPDMGATVTAKPLRVALKKGKDSDPISFSAKWPGKPFDVSGWESEPSDPVADPIFANARASSVTARWKDPGTYTVTAFLIHFPPGGGAFIQAAPSEEIHVILVEFKDENGNDADGLSLGITTGNKDRSRMLTATVTPASQTDKVTLKVTKGGGALAIKNINPGNGTITFQAEGIGKEGSKAKNDCTIEAQVEGKEAGKMTATVVVPKRLRQTPGTATSRNLQANSGTSPAFPGAQGPFLAIVETFYFIPVTVTVSDQFGQPIVDPNNPKLYLGAPVFEQFQVKGTKPFPINLTITANSDYVDPVGVQIWQNWPAPPPITIFNPIFNPGSAPLFAFPNLRPPLLAPSKTDVFQALVDGFPLEPIVTRVLTVELGGVLSLTTTP